MKNINIILSHSKNFVIGYDNNIPWFYEEEFQYFNDMTISKTDKQNAVIMGYNTFYNKQTSLKNRINIVIDKKISTTVSKNDIIFVNSLSKAIIYCKENDKINDIFIIGGEKIFNEASIFGFLAILLAAVNIFGGFLVTHRMLAMYKKKKK